MSVVSPTATPPKTRKERPSRKAGATQESTTNTTMSAALAQNTIVTAPTACSVRERSAADGPPVRVPITRSYPTLAFLRYVSILLSRGWTDITQMAYYWNFHIKAGCTSGDPLRPKFAELPLLRGSVNRATKRRGSPLG